MQIWESGTSKSNHNLAISKSGMSLGYVLKEGTVHSLARKMTISFHLSPIDNNTCISEDTLRLLSCATTAS